MKTIFLLGFNKILLKKILIFSTRPPQENACYIYMLLFISNHQYAVWFNESRRRNNFDLSSSNEWIVTTDGILRVSIFQLKILSYSKVKCQNHLKDFTIFIKIKQNKKLIHLINVEETPSIYQIYHEIRFSLHSHYFLTLNFNGNKIFRFAFRLLIRLAIFYTDCAKCNEYSCSW